jgi:hypothetical protein
MNSFRPLVPSGFPATDDRAGQAGCSIRKLSAEFQCRAKTIAMGFGELGRTALSGTPILLH